jgi:hypothetical protein
MKSVKVIATAIATATAIAAASVIPAKAGIQHRGTSWIPACAGMTGKGGATSWIPACAGMTGGTR